MHACNVNLIHSSDTRLPYMHVFLEIKQCDNINLF